MKMKNKEILIVEDDPMLLESSAILLQRHFNVTKASDGKQAWEHINSARVDCVLLDIEIPVMSGLEFLKKARDYGYKVPIIIVTGKSCLEYAEKCADLGVNGYIIKPYRSNEVIEKINDLVEAGHDREIRPDPLKDLKHQKLREVVDYINVNFSDAISMINVSRKLGISSAYLSRLFKKEMGLTFTDYVNGLRIEEAKKLIKDSELTISEISLKAGFGSEQNFFKLFKRYTGVTPKKFRE